MKINPLRPAAALTLLWMCALQAAADADITRYVMINAGFDRNYNHTAAESGNVAQELNEVPCWTSELSADYTVSGVYEFGYKGTFNGATVPAAGYNGEAGGALALSTGWSQTFCYSQTITLQQGTYTISVPTYNGKTQTAGSSMLAFIPTLGDPVYSTLTSYPGKQWTVDRITFTVPAARTGKLRIGYTAAAGASSASAAPVIDYVKVEASAIKPPHRTILNRYKSLYKEGNPGAEELKALYDAYIAAHDNSEATVEELATAYYELMQGFDDYAVKNASDEKPIDRTDRIVNPSFEVDGTAGWKVAGMNRQSNSAFLRKKGSYYMESWVPIGQHIGEASLEQTLAALPAGYYKLTAAALHIQQKSSGSNINQGDPQTGAWLYAGANRVEITASDNYVVSFAVLSPESEVAIGLKTSRPTGNYLCVDNFTLQCVGPVTPERLAEEVRISMQEAQSYLELGIQNSAATVVNNALAQARDALEGAGDEATLIAAREALIEAIAAAAESRARYDALASRIEYAEKVASWWEGVVSKAAALSSLKSYIATAKIKLTDYAQTDAQIATVDNTLKTRTAAVDKKIYCSVNACGTDEQLKKKTSQWCYDRSMQSKHWILFWEAGYGEGVPAAVPEILNNADRIFELNAGELAYITINQGKSKTDTYKMIIRLRYTTEWEASGSGIDDQIGLLTLSNGAHTSRSGQTVAHEIGHCFQYQVHCDNGNWNGWMYNWGASTLNVFWEMCAQWQAYKYYPEMQFGNEWFWNTLNGLHRHPLCVNLRYNNYFIQDYFCHRHGMDFLGRLWNRSYNPEDPLQAYMRLTMSGTAAQKLDRLGDEMWEYGARMTTFDLDPIRDLGASWIDTRNQTELVKNADDSWTPTAANCIENWGNNAIRLNVPSKAKTVYVEFTGEAGKTGYTAYNTSKAGWKLGFVALKTDGTRIYGDIGTATYAEPRKDLAFDCPSGVSRLWLVVSGAPTSYWTRDWLSWDGESTAEQWPYSVKFYQTNVLGQPNNEGYPTSVRIVRSTENEDDNDGPVYDMNGRRLNAVPEHGLYIRGGKVYSR